MQGSVPPCASNQLRDLGWMLDVTRVTRISGPYNGVSGQKKAWEPLLWELCIQPCTGFLVYASNANTNTMKDTSSDHITSSTSCTPVIVGFTSLYSQTCTPLHNEGFICYNTTVISIMCLSTVYCSCWKVDHVLHWHSQSPVEKWLLFLTYLANAQLHAQFWTQCPTLFADVPVIDLHADVTLDSVPVEAWANWAVFDWSFWRLTQITTSFFFFPEIFCNIIHWSLFFIHITEHGKMLIT